MTSKISIGRIIADHFRTFKNGDRYDKPDIFIFFVIPAIVAIVAVAQSCEIPGALSSVLITALTILAGLLFNLLLLVYDVAQVQGSTDIPAKAAKTKRLLLKEVYANISFAILISILAIVLLCIDAGLPAGYVQYLRCSVVALIHFAAVALILDLLMILKRVHSLLKASFD